MRASDTVRLRLAGALAGILILGGCGDSRPQLAPIEREELHAFVERARSAATARDLPATSAALEALQARVRTLREAGRIDRETAGRLLKYSAIAQLRARTTLGSGPPPAPAAEADPGGGNDKGNEKAKDKDKNKNNDKADGNGNGNGNGNDKADE